MNSYVPTVRGAFSSAYAPPLRGDDFESLLSPLLDRAFGAALHMTRNHADAEDLVQEAALLAFRAFRTFTPGTNFKAWFFRILVNCFYSNFRRHRHDRAVQQLEEPAELHVLLRSSEFAPPPYDADPGRAAVGRMQAEQVAAALQELPEELRVVATMYFIEDFAYQEIADVLRVPIGTVRSRLHRARRALRQRLWQLAEDQGLISVRTAAGGGGEGIA